MARPILPIPTDFDATVTLEASAKHYGVSVPTVRRWRREGAPLSRVALNVAMRLARVEARHPGLLLALHAVSGGQETVGQIAQRTEISRSYLHRIVGWQREAAAAIDSGSCATLSDSTPQPCTNTSTSSSTREATGPAGPDDTP